MLKLDHRLFSSLLLLLSAAGILTACQAALETKQGGIGEFCNNRDTDCRDGLICQDSVCAPADPTALNACESICIKLDACAIDEGNCLADCGRTVENWGATQIDDFEQCIVDDQTCDDLGDNADQAAQFCYNQLTLPAEREATCQLFVNEVNACDASLSTQTLRSECLFAARTVDEETWAGTEECADAVQFGTCDEVITCLNTFFLPSNDGAPIAR